MFKQLKVVGAAILLVIALTACSSQQTASQASAGANEGLVKNSEASAKAGEASTETRSYTDQFGEVTIPVHPQRLLVLSTRYAEYLISLGVNPQMVTYVPIAEPEYREELFTSHGVQMVKYPQYEQNYELLLELSPDMILGMSAGMDAEVYERLNKIAPTVALPAGPSMEEAFPLLADLFDKKAEYQAVMAEFNQKAEQAKAALGQALGNKTVMVLRVEPKDYRVLGQLSNLGSSKLFYHQLGLNIPAVLANEKAWFTSLSQEKLPEIDPDFIFIEVRAAEGSNSEGNWKELEKSNLWKNMKAVRAGHVYPLKTNDFVGGEGPIGYSRLIDYIVSCLLNK